ncbi:MAG: hypothetical protein WDA27_07710 [Actinomycetota bacterium]
MSRARAKRWVARASAIFLLMLVLGSVGGALVAQTPEVPTITSAPADPTNNTAAAFTFTTKKTPSSFQCALDGATFAACGSSSPSTKTYSGPLASGGHSFQVRSVSGSTTTAPSTYSWTIDTTAPRALLVNRTGATPTNAGSVSWTVTFDENVIGVDASDFRIERTGLGGTASVTSVSGSGAAYNVSASTGTGSGTLALNLVDDDSIVDRARNALGGVGVGNGNRAGQSYSIDKLPPPTPVITEHPDDPDSSADAGFVWTSSEDGVAFHCKIEAGSWNPCVSPFAFTVDSSNFGTHQFAVRAADAAGNLSQNANYSWKVDTSKKIFGIIPGGTESRFGYDELYPGVWRWLEITLTNPHNFAISVTSLTVTVVSSPASCLASTNIEIEQAPLSATHPVVVPRGGSVAMTGTDRPRIRLRNLPTNQDACKGAHFGLSYKGSATK